MATRAQLIAQQLNSALEPRGKGWAIPCPSCRGETATIYDAAESDSIICFCPNCGGKAPWHALREKNLVLNEFQAQKVDKSLCSREITDTYIYEDVDGSEVLTAQRANYFKDGVYQTTDITHLKAGKRCNNGTPGIFYNLKSVTASGVLNFPIVEVETEPAAEALNGTTTLITTCFPFNSKDLKRWLAYEPWRYLTGCEYVAIVPSNTKDSLEIAQKKATEYLKNGISAKVVPLPGLNALEGVEEWINAYNKAAEFQELIENAPEFTPIAQAEVIELFPADANKLLTEKYAAAQWLQYAENHCLFIEEKEDWYSFDGKAFTQDKNGARTKIHCSDFLDETFPNILKTARLDPLKAERFLNHVRNKSGISNVVTMGSWKLQRSINLFDQDPLLINLQNGTVDLNSGSIVYRKARNEDLISKVAGFNYKPGAECPKWLAFQHWLFNGDASLCLWNQVFAGYSLLGVAGEQTVRINKGEGENGKSIDSNVRMMIGGTYSGSIKARAFMKKQNETQLDSLTQLVGRRHVVVSEIAKGAVFADDVIKDVSGGDEVQVRYLFGEPQPTTFNCKLEFRTNYAPGGTADHAFHRRLKFVPYLQTVTKEQKIKHFDKLLMREEGDGIGLWALEGALMYLQLGGLPECPRIDALGKEYRGEMDRVAQFTAAWGRPKEETLGRSMRQATAYAYYKFWCQEEGFEYLPSPTAFASEMLRLGYEKGLTHGRTTIKGFAVKLEIKNKYGEKANDDE